MLEHEFCGVTITAITYSSCPLWVISATWPPVLSMSALPPIADIRRTACNVRYVPIATKCTAANGAALAPLPSPARYGAREAGVCEVGAVKFRDRVEVVNPRLLRANKYLPAWHQFISLAKRSKAHVVGFWLIAS